MKISAQKMILMGIILTGLLAFGLISHATKQPVLQAEVALAMGDPNISNRGLVTVESDNSFDETVMKLQNALEEAGLNIFGVVDHAANAENAGLELPPTTLIIFGNPNIGTPLMQSSRTIGIDLPQKFLVWEAEDGTVYVTYNNPHFLGRRHGIRDQQERLNMIANALSNFATVATTAD